MNTEIEAIKFMRNDIIINMEQIIDERVLVDDNFKKVMSDFNE